MRLESQLDSFASTSETNVSLYCRLVSAPLIPAAALWMDSRFARRRQRTERPQKGWHQNGRVSTTSSRNLTNAHSPYLL